MREGLTGILYRNSPGFVEGDFQIQAEFDVEVGILK
jgi:hypothetical protein